MLPAWYKSIIEQSIVSSHLFVTGAIVMRTAGRIAIEEKRARAKLRREIEPRMREMNMRRINRDEGNESLN